ncbi:hypothetical protein, partial [Nocardia abscessus]|uniref:hypothetical protein n=1 Tax=Nocardia abscessus TaxID=120957 RepID=UPI00245865DF
IGHASHAAGMASLFKVLLAMRAGQLPPSLHVAAVNPLLGLDESPVFVKNENRPGSRNPPPGAGRRMVGQRGPPAPAGGRVLLAARG